MASTEFLRRQHRELLHIAEEILDALKTDILESDAVDIRSKLSKLSGKLNVHLIMEDKSIYPELLNHRDDKVKTLASDFVDEMGGLSSAFERYKKKWPSPTSIRNDVNGFTEDTKEIFNDLSKRIYREDNELYPVIEKSL